MKIFHAGEIKTSREDREGAKKMRLLSSRSTVPLGALAP